MITVHYYRFRLSDLYKKYGIRSMLAPGAHRLLVTDLRKDLGKHGVLKDNGAEYSPALDVYVVCVEEYYYGRLP